jgi:aminoglycoside phosphotransferase family enzyme/predicted kinase
VVPTVDEFKRDLGRPEAYPHHPDSVEIRETHISLVFLAGDRAYKVKKTVRFRFIDLMDKERREELCHEEVRLNAELAGDLYRGVIAITRGADGRLRFGGDGEAVEHAVEMNRFPEERLVSQLLLTSEGQEEIGHALPALVEKLATFHANAPRADEFGTADAVAQRMLPVLELAEEKLAPVLARPIRAHLEARLREWPALFGMRASQGFVREGHGDLHAANICLPPGGIEIYDRLEFARAMRCGDVAFDIAFLAMSFDFAGARDLSRQLRALYAEWTGDLDFERLCAFYRVQRALVRANVARMRGGEEERARQYDRLAAGYVAAPCAVFLCGLPATGKTTLAEQLVAPLGAETLRSDVVRKRMAGMAETERWSGDMYGGPYAPEMTDRVYERLVAMTRSRIDAGRSVIVDATLRHPTYRAMLIDAVGSVPWIVLHLVRTDEEVHRNLAARRERGGHVSDADEAYYHEAKRTFGPPDEINPAHLVVDDGTNRENVLDEIVGRLAAMRVAT